MTDARGVLAPDILHAAARTDPGRARANNEDLPLIDPARGIFGVIDGVGGEAGGEVAAAIARDVIVQRLARPLGTPAERVREAIAIANNEIFRRAQETPELRGMACVVTVAVIADGRMVIGHVGDARLYKIFADGHRKITRDHSPVGEREDAGELSEVDAMRHPRRNEVFRDVGSLFRDKDEAEFVDIIDEPMEPDSAVLVCSDGLSDMLPSPTIAHIVRQHAGDPARAVEALVAAANDAGGKDNITVVYAEGPLFAATLRGEIPESLTPTEPLNGRVQTAPPAPNRSFVARVVHAVASSRTTWFIAGILLGVIGALALTMYVARTQVRGAQTFVVSSNGSAEYLRIGEAMAVARPGDRVVAEPGEYLERVVVADGVDLLARVPGTVTIRRPDGLHPSIPTLTAGGSTMARVSGIRLTSGAEAPAAAVSAAGAGVALSMMEIAHHGRALEIAPGSSISMHGSRVGVGGSLVSVPATSQAGFSNNIFVRNGGGSAEDPPIVAVATSRLTLSGNVFAGFTPEIVRGLSAARRSELLAGNIVVPPVQAQRSAPARRTGAVR